MQGKRATFSVMKYPEFDTINGTWVDKESISKRNMLYIKSHAARNAKLPAQTAELQIKCESSERIWIS